MPDVDAMSPREMTSGSVGYAAQVQGALKTVEAMRERARQDQDIVRLTCLNDKMLQLKGEANVFDHARITFEDSVSNSDDISVVRAAYVQLQIPGEHAQTLNEDARTCLGVLDLTSAEGTDTKHDDFPDDPTVGDPFEPEIEPPNCASPFR